MRIRKKLRIFFLLFSLSFGFFAVKVNATAPPIRDPKYAASYVGQSIPDPIVMEAGSTKTVTVRFKNVGEVTWVNSGQRYISAYTDNPRLHSSLFFGKNWESPKQTATIKKSTKPGAIAELPIELLASSKPGDYTEYFHLSASR